MIRASVTQGSTVAEGTYVDLVVSLGPETQATEESQSSTQQTYTGTVDFSSLSNPIGGLGENETATVRVDVYNASGTLVWTTGDLTMGPGDWQSQYLVTSSDGTPATWQLYINGAAVSSGAVVNN